MNNKDSTENDGSTQNLARCLSGSKRQRTRRFWMIQSFCVCLLAAITILLAPVCHSELCGYSAGALMLLFGVGGILAGRRGKLFKKLEEISSFWAVILKVVALCFVLLLMIVAVVSVFTPLPTDRVLPFDVRGTTSIDGEALAGLLVSELRRIDHIYKTIGQPQYPPSLKRVEVKEDDTYLTRINGISVPAEKSRVKTNVIDLLSRPSAESIATDGRWLKVANAISIGDLRIPLDKLLLWLRQCLYLENEKFCVTGSLTQSGNMVHIAAKVEKPDPRIWEVRGVIGASEGIKPLVSELAYKIGNDLFNDANTKQWDSYRELTAGAEAFSQYCRTEMLEDLDTAQRHCSAAVSLDRPCKLAIEMLYNMSIFYEARGEYSNAVQAASLAYIHTNTWEVARVYIDALIQNNKLIEADTVCREGLKKNHRNDILHERRAQCLIRLGQHEEAIAELRLAQSCNTNQHAYYTTLGKLFLNLDRFKEAKDQFELAIGIQPDTAYPYFLLSLAHRGLGRYREAVAKIDIGIAKEKKAKQYGPMGPWTRAVILEDLGCFEEAEKQCKVSLDNDPHFSAARMQLGTVFCNQGRYGEAIRLYEAVITSDPNNAEAHLFLGRIHRELGNWDEAIKEIERAAEISPKSALIRRSLSVAYVMKDDLHMAEQEIKKAELLDMEDPDDFDKFLLGAIRHRQSRYAEARSLWKDAVARGSGGTVYGRLFYVLNMVITENPEGLKEFRKILNKDRRPPGGARNIQEMVEVLKHCSVKTPAIEEISDLIKATMANGVNSPPFVFPEL